MLIRTFYKVGKDF
ncbi:hypothetical protein PENSTE_c043G05043 [Penicillium steckii]|uniref:Uncharacterized protein n=1 Tax=Penicillium steckii TaxID=303698 RepID=A0A1V6SII6_9EURO|nr:hypothetical protein PENSTE_c043G05043 [Penicillium steckii]